MKYASVPYPVQGKFPLAGEGRRPPKRALPLVIHGLIQPQSASEGLVTLHPRLHVGLLRSTVYHGVPQWRSTERPSGCLALRTSTQSTGTIAGLLAEHIPLDGVLIRPSGPSRLSVETVAVGLPAESLTSDGRTECPPERMEGLLDWCRQGRVLQGGGGREACGRRFCLPPSKAGVLAGPLRLPGDRYGVLVLVGRAAEHVPSPTRRTGPGAVGSFFGGTGERPAGGEMAALREAAEADKRSLLTRLGREKLGDTIVGADSGLRASWNASSWSPGPTCRCLSSVRRARARS